MRQWQMLRLIPRHPIKISTPELIQGLSDEGYRITQRTIQRDLIRLSEIFPLMCDERNRPFGWSWMVDADVMDIPGMDSHTALAFWLAEKHLEPLLPQATLRQLQGHFKAAANVLDHTPSDKGAPAWRHKVRVLHRGPGLKVPAIDPEIQGAVYDALLRNRRLDVTYAPRRYDGNKNYELNPLGLVLKDGIIYLVCSMRDYSDIRLLTLHRIVTAKQLDIPVAVPEGFDLDDYIASGALNFIVGGKIRLKARLSKDVAFHLEERPLSDDQTLIAESDGWSMLTASVQDTSELHWWLLGFGEQVDVIEPASLREELLQVVSVLYQRYSSSTDSTGEGRA